MTFETLKFIIFFVLLADAFIVNLIAWFGSAWYTKNFKTLSSHLPLTKPWAVAYFLLVVWIGLLTF